MRVSQSKYMNDQPGAISPQNEGANSGGSGPAPLTYEETPVIEPVATEESPPPAEQKTTVSSPHSIAGTVGFIVVFVILFFIGMGLSIVLRQYLGSSSDAVPAKTSPLLPRITPTPSPTLITDMVSPPATPSVTGVPEPSPPDAKVWKSYPVISGTTKQPVERIVFMLPPDVPLPSCDGESCASQGTFLSGGTRFTVAPRGRGQLLVDARGNVGLTDAAGKPFTVKQVVLENGRKALEYTGEFSGSTVGGYTFTRMHGFMVEIDEGITLEMNHFAPAGLTVDFIGDELVFVKIVKSIERGNVPSTPTTTPRVITPTATSSGY